MSECTYDCSENRSEADIPRYDDISGLGVLIGYTGTAGLAVLIIAGYYFFGHQPELNPFWKEGEARQNRIADKPHSIDKLILGDISKLLHKLARQKKNLNPSTAPPSVRRLHFEKALLKCILMMSDLQILTGLSILVSGYSQLPCGLTIYHWQVLVYLAWFSSITHLSCLTFLRNHLYNHPGQRTWRLFGMGAIVILLVGALLPTGNNLDDTPPANYAFCMLKHPGPSRGTELSYTVMILSVLLLSLGFLSRVVRLHRTLSVNTVTAARKYSSELARKNLHKLLRWCDSPSQSARGKLFSRLFYYRPALAVFLASRAALDLWSSAFLEVWWLVVSFAWGTINLTQAIGDQIHSTKQDWTFGQVAPMFLLSAPFLAALEFFVEKPIDAQDTPTLDEENINDTVSSSIEAIELTDNTHPTPDPVNDNPDHDFYKDPWFHVLVYFLLWSVLFDSIYFLIVYGLGELEKGEELYFFIPTGGLDIISWFAFLYILGMVTIALFSLVGLGRPSTSRLLTQCVSWLLFLCPFTLYTILSYFVGSFEVWMITGSFATLYVFLSFFFIVREPSGSE